MRIRVLPVRGVLGKRSPQRHCEPARPSPDAGRNSGCWTPAKSDNHPAYLDGANSAVYSRALAGLSVAERVDLQNLGADSLAPVRIRLQQLAAFSTSLQSIRLSNCF